MARTTSTDQRLTVVPVPGVGAEDVAVSKDGTVYTGTVDGAVFAVQPDTGNVSRVGTTGGRPLGIEVLPDGRLLICDAHQGLLTLDPHSGKVQQIADSVAGVRMVFCNNAAVAADGTIYFSDSSKVHPIERWRADMIEDTHSGRLLRIRPDSSSSTGYAAPEILAEGLRFANGVALNAEESFVCVAETAGRTVVRRWLTGPRRGQVDHLVTDLPGYPDNIALGSDGLIWVTIASPVDKILEEVLPKAPRLVKSLVWRLPDRMQPQPQRTARVMAFDEDGTLVHDRGCVADDFHMVTGVREHQGRVWLGSLVEPAVAWFDL